MVYFVKVGHSDLVKIGFTTDLTRRLASLRLQSDIREILENKGGELQVVGVMEGDLVVEHGIHATFQEDRIHREVFVLSDNIAEFISSHCIPWESPGVPNRERLELKLSRQAKARISAAATLRGEDKSEVVERLVNDHLPDLDQFRAVLIA